MCNKIIATPPGETIRELLIYRDISNAEFATKMDMSEANIELLLDGKTIIDISLAGKLRKVFGVPSTFWINLEHIYRKKLKEIESKGG